MVSPLAATAGRSSLSRWPLCSRATWLSAASSCSRGQELVASGRALASTVRAAGRASCRPLSGSRGQELAASGRALTSAVCGAGRASCWPPLATLVGRSSPPLGERWPPRSAQPGELVAGRL